ncbi:MAG TPA: Gfo/Idh/MocA family oxidoreductase [Candidatus Sphingobacterium stercoripullorum]|uniref:Gfo/Idh/MocA family oxidoreductase n=1 Tax=Candidatus Sphingobacterium stercoripullorum TaxID=2838759 RepID=A0A9D1W8K8_9SPHI|nr:Gfo/Idh/MocA family oxidoreductase [Candidatus Sphingobacterium stercoripullorum]
MIKKINTGVLSYGMSGRVFHTPFLEASELFNLRAIVERNKKNAAADYPNIISYDSVDELLADEEIELVVVNTPNDTHYDFANAALQAGKHILVEKPLVPSSSQAEALFELAKRAGKKIFTFHNRRFDSDFLSLKKVLEGNLVGDPIELHLRFDRYRPEIGPKVFKETNRPASGVLYDLGSHLLDQAISLFGRPKAYYKVRSGHRDHTKVEDYGFILLEFDNQVTVHITTSLLVGDPQASFVLHGKNGSFIKARSDVQEEQLIAGMTPNDPLYGLEDKKNQGKLTVLKDGNQAESSYLEAPKGEYMQLFNAIYESIRLDKPYFVKPEDIITQLQILESV